MTEIFEIGVSLALQDGVSDAIGQARRDVAALGEAVRESGLSLRSLREVGARAASVAFAEPRHEAADGPVKRAAPDVPPRAETAVEPRSEAFVAAPAQRVAVEGSHSAPWRMEAEVASPLDVTGASEADMVSRVRGERDACTTPVAPDSAVHCEETILAQAPAPLQGAGRVAEDTGAPISRVRAPVQELVQPAPAERTKEPVPTAGSFVDAPNAPAPLAPLGDARQVGAPIEIALPAALRQDEGRVSARELTPVAAPPLVPGAAQTPLETVQMPALMAAPANWAADDAADTPPPGGSAGGRPETQSKRAAPIALVRALRLSGGMGPVPQDDDEPGDTTRDVAAPKDEPAPDTPAIASVWPCAMPAPAAQGQVTAPGARDRRIEQAGGHETGPNEGDVFLDGMLVGRWMSRFLTREAERASVGPTGFDARRGRLLPGVTVGG